MKKLSALSTILACLFACIAGAQEKDGPAPKLDEAAIEKLVGQLKSTDFKTRQLAEKELLKLEDIPAPLREAAKSADLETRRRAQAIVDVINGRLEEKAFQAMLKDMHKIEIDRFVRRMVTDEKFADDKAWGLIEKFVQAVVKRANELGGREYPVPKFDLKSMPLANPATERIWSGKRVLLDNHNGSIWANNNVILCTGTLPRETGISNSIILVDGDMVGATSLSNSLVIVSGKLGRFTGIRNSIVLVVGEFGVKEGFGQNELRGATSANSSFFQVKNDKVRFTGADDCTFIKTTPVGGRGNQVLDTDKGPLQLLKFASTKAVADDQLKWGKESNGLNVAIAPTDRPASFLIRWKNVGKETLELRAVRFHNDILGGGDDLLNHVLVKDADGKLLPARQLGKFPGAGARIRPATIILEPGKTFDETIELPSYVARPDQKGKYQLSIEFEVDHLLADTPSQKGAVYWTGKVRSGELEIQFGK